MRQKTRNCLLWGAVLTPAAAFYLSVGCPIRFLTGISCPGCGMSRAVLSVCRMDLTGAMHFHPLVFLTPVFALLIFIFRNKTKASAAALCVFFVALLGVYLYRWITGSAPDVVYCRPQEGVIYKLFQVIRSVFYVS